MNPQIQFYVTELLVLFCVNIIAVWGLDLQFGVTGINNFAFVIYQAAGAYTAAILTLGPQSGNGAFQSYILGATVPYPVSVIVAGAVAGAIAVPLGFVGMLNLRGDYQAVVMLVISVIAVGLATAAVNVVNGPAGLALIPQPLDQLTSSSTLYAWIYVGIAAVWALLAFCVVRWVTASPFGRILRAIRDSESAAATLGWNVLARKMIAFVIGGVLAGISGAVYVQYLGAWGPGSWQYQETFLFLTAIIVGGTGNMLGGALGVAIVCIGFQELTRFLPNIGYPGMTASLQWVLIGLLMLAFLWFRPRGLVPERRRLLAAPRGLLPGVAHGSGRPGSRTAALDQESDVDVHAH